ncbi:MAG: hypothetical protein J6Z43_09330 [Clostridiales bacterium]|nr:hypothetical protein [Clostridiales bacterium]
MMTQKRILITLLTIAVTALIVVALVFVFRKRLGMLDRYIIIRDLSWTVERRGRL